MSTMLSSLKKSSGLLVISAYLYTSTYYFRDTHVHLCITVEKEKTFSQLNG